MNEAFTLTVSRVFSNIHRGMRRSTLPQNWFSRGGSPFISTQGVSRPESHLGQSDQCLPPDFSLASGSRKEGLFPFKIPKGIFVDLETDTNPKYSSKFRNGSVRRRYRHIVHESSFPPIISNSGHLSRESTIQF
jgi:hypothetical protein